MKKYLKIIVALVTALLVSSLALLFHHLELLDNTQKSLSNSLYKGRTINSEVVLISIDENTLKDPSQGGLGQLGGWSREYYSQVIQNLEASGASAIMVDVLFSQSSNGLNNDTLLDILQEHSTVEDFGVEVLSYLSDPHPEDQAFAEAIAPYDNLYFIKTTAGEPTLTDNHFHYPYAIEPIEAITEVAHTGYANLAANENSNNTSVIYAIPAVENVAGIQEEHIDLKLVREHLGLSDETGDFSEDNQEYHLDEGHKIPLEKGQMLINYAQKPYTWEAHSFVDVYYNSLDSSLFEDKIVLIGATTAALQDVFYTPIDDAVPMAGVEIHANAIHTLLDTAFLEHQSSGNLWLFIFGLTLLSALAFVYLPILPGALLIGVEILAFPIFAQWRFNQGHIIDLIWPIVALIATYLSVLAYRNITEFREKRRLQSAFSHYVSPELVKQISKNPEQLKLGGERRVITTLFLDIENFTRLSEAAPPESVVQIINTYFDALAQIILQMGGTVDKFEGDAIMALFGAPIKHKDHAQRACRAALAMQSKIKELNAQTGQNLNIRIGIATGDSIVGNMGSKTRFDYTAMGDTVNTASRLESGNKFYKTRILVNAECMKAGQNELIFRRIDRVRLKGKETPIDIYELMPSSEHNTQPFLNEWHQCLEYYRNSQWKDAERRLKELLERFPNDGPAEIYLQRIAYLSQNPPKTWDGTWNLGTK